MSDVAAPDDVTVAEVARTVSDFRAEFRASMSQMVRADVYREGQNADRARIGALEESTKREQNNRDADRRLVLGAIITAVASVVVTLIVAALGH